MHKISFMKKYLFTFLLAAISVIAFSQITITSTVTNVSCFGGSNGSATVSVAGGTAPYTYTWTPSAINSPVISGLTAGAYTVTVMDASMGTNSLVVNISQPTQLIVATTQTNVTCWGLCNGTAIASTNGGTAPYIYSWSQGQIIPTASNLCAGVYTVSVTDLNGCSSTNSVNITQPTILISQYGKTNTTCYGQCNGSYTLTGIGGTLPYNYVTNTGTVTSYNPNLCAGTYTVQLIDANGCAPSPNTIIINSGNSTIPNISSGTTPFNETCYLSGDGVIDLTISGTNPGPFTYTWSNGANTQDIYNIESNSYWVTIIDANSNCTTLFDTINSIGINCGSISGNVYIDNNSDCLQNSGDNNYQSATIEINPGNRLGYTNANGDYVINNLPYNSYSVSILNSLGVIPSCATALNTQVNSTFPNSINNNFSVAFNSAVLPDMLVSAYSNGIVPGFTCSVGYSLKNLNNVSSSGLFKVILPSAFITNITSGTPNTYTISGDTIIWTFTNITNSGGTNYYFIYFTTPLSTPLGSTFTSCAYAQTSTPDFNPANNTYCYSRIVTGSFDPNDKTVSPVGVGATGDIATSVTDLTYLIRFQNTGNGPAVNIVVKDTLSSNVDVNTFEMLGSSHNYNIEILPGNILKWKFNNIMLPDSNSNEPGSHGYIQYRIKRNNNNTPGTQIKNTAYIYFDFNEPVVTNTAINTIETITGITTPLSNNDGWNVYPNPSTGALYIVNSSVSKEASQVQVLNAISQTVLEETITSNYKNIDLSKLNNGVYFVKIISDKQSVIQRVVLSK